MASPTQITPEMLAGPAMMPPAGVTPNFVDPYSTGPILIAVGAILVALMIGFVTNRIVTKALVIGTWTWDDLTCVIGMLLAVAYYGMSVVGVTQCKFGTHQWNVTLETYISNTTAIVEYLAEVLAPITLLFIKDTFFLLFLNLFKPVRSLRIAIWFGLGFTTLFYVLAFILAFVSGTPRPGETWLGHEEFNPIIDIEVDAAIWQPAVGIIIDLYILILPLYCMSTLHLPTKRKIAAGSVFLTGIIAVIASILSLVYRVYIYHDPLDDLTYNQIPAYITSVVEMTLGVMISCTPALSRMLRHVQPSWVQLRSRLSSRYGSGTGSRETDTFASSKSGGMLGSHGVYDSMPSNGYSFAKVQGAAAGKDKDRTSSEDDDGVELAHVRGPDRTYLGHPRQPQDGQGNRRDPRREHTGIRMQYDIRQETHAASLV